MMAPARFERATYTLGGGRVILLCHGDIDHELYQQAWSLENQLVRDSKGLDSQLAWLLINLSAEISAADTARISSVKNLLLAYATAFLRRSEQ